MGTLADPSWLWLENSAVSTLIREWVWLYPALETLHILGLALLFGSVAMFDLRLLGVSRQLCVTDMSRHLLPWTYSSFGLVVVTGLLMFATDATEIAVNPAFRLKLLLITAAGINAALFHGGAYRSVRLWNREVKAPATVRLTAVFSLILWIGVIVCGRLIAYL